MLVPLYGFLRGDSIGLLVLVHDHQTVAEVGAVLQEAAAVRVATRGAAQVRVQGRLLDPGLTVAAAGLSAMDRVDVSQEGDE
jgi:hypothetical protein